MSKAKRSDLAVEEVPPREALEEAFVKHLEIVESDDESEDEGGDEEMVHLTASWVETAKKHVIHIDAPGTDKSDLKVHRMGNSVFVSNRCNKLPGDSVLSFGIRDYIKMDELKASFSGGNIALTLPKAQDQALTSSSSTE